MNIVTKRCSQDNCDIYPNFGPVNGKATHCAMHGRERGLKDIVSILCLEIGCTKQPRFGPHNGKKRTHCTEHKKKGFISDYKKCLSKGCTKQPSYGPAGKNACLLYTSPSPRDGLLSRMPSSA